MHTRTCMCGALFDLRAAPLHSKHPCIVSGGGGPLLSVLQIYSEGRILSFSCAFAGWTSCYCWCIAVYLVFRHPRRTLHPAEQFSFSQFQSRTQLVLLSIFQRSGGSIVPAKILGPSEHGAAYWTITYECSGTVVTHDCAPIAQMSVVHVPTTP